MYKVVKLYFIYYFIFIILVLHFIENEQCSYMVFIIIFVEY